MPGDAEVVSGQPVEGRGVVVVNPGAGPGGTSVEAVARHFPGHDVQPCADELVEQVQDAVAGGAAFVGIAGGDGTIRTAASVLTGTGVPLLPIPAGTRNHFATELGILEVADAAKAVAGGAVRLVDLAEVNGRVFVNNASIGLYARVVRRRHLADRKRWKVVTAAAGMGRQLAGGRSIPVTLAGEDYRTWVVFVGNGAYGTNLVDLADRERLDGHVLDVRLLRADRRFAVVRIVASLAIGRLEESKLVPRWLGPELDLDIPLPSVDVALDGEVVQLRPPLAFRSRPGALAVLSGS